MKKNCSLKYFLFIGCIFIFPEKIFSQEVAHQFYFMPKQLGFSNHEMVKHSALTESTSFFFHKFDYSRYNRTNITLPAAESSPLFPLKEKKEVSAFFCDQQASAGKKLLRAELMSLTLQGLGYLFIFVQPAEKTYWKTSNARSNYRRAFTNPPVWDHDNWLYNYLGHPVTGAIHYNILRSQDVKPHFSFLYSTAQSVIWEYLIESSQEQPSIQDLLVTSTAGTVLGEIIHIGTIEMKKNGFTTFEKIVVTIINPMYVINNGYRTTHETTNWWRKK